jgi:Fic-DOC domain mobile mystery protein B
MYGHVWKWAGDFRRTQKNIGVEPWLIPNDLKVLLDDSMLWFKESVFEPEELAIRFKQRLVSIHCFSNGNGRHSRLMADIIIQKIYKQKPFSWGAESLPTSEQRDAYIAAVKAADRDNMLPLLAFARS